MEKENENKTPEMKMSDELVSLMSFIKDEISKELPTLSIDANYFLLGALAHKNNDLYRRLESCMTSMAIQSMYNTWYQVISSKAIAAVKPNRVPTLDSKMVKTMMSAVDEAVKLGAEELTSEHVFLAILSDVEDSNKIRKVFNKAGITYGIMVNKIKEGKPLLPNGVEMIELPNGMTMTQIRASSKKEAEEIAKKMMDNMANSASMQDMSLPGIKKRNGKASYISEYCVDLNKLAAEGKIEPLVGRDREINEIIRILGRKKKNNVILLGGEGVGKTAIGEALALRIVNADVPGFLLKRKLVSLDMTALMAGTTLRGMFEERVKGIMDDIKSDPSYMLFMDNIGAILADKGKNDFEFSSMISRALENGEIQVIGTSDFASYRKTFDKDPSLARRFQKVIVEAPTEKESIDILNGLKESYEKHHGVVYDDDAILSCVSLAERYMTERNLPDSAIDIMDEAGALVGTVYENDEIVSVRKAIKELRNKAASEKKLEGEDEAKMSELTAKYKSLKKELEDEKAANPRHITKDVILDVVSTKTGIPVNNLTSDDKKKLATMDDRIKEGVIGQDKAIETICKALKRNRIGLRKGGCMYSAICIGKTGVGKTLIAKKLAKELFGSEDALVRFDMSEYSDKVSVNKLIGSNPGYVGYEEGGQLTEAIKKKKHSVLLLDEIEKADPEVYNIFLQVLDEGFLTDNSGMKVSFSNVIVLFTSNVGAKAASDFGRGIGFNEKEDENSKRILTKQLKNRFPPEFLNRIDDVIYFNSLTDDNLKDIIRIEMNKLSDNIESIGHHMEYDDDVVMYLLNIVKDEREFGARPIMRAIQDNIEDKITDSILINDYGDGHTFKISCDKGLSDVVVA